LDVLRCFAIGAVLVSHLGTHFFQPFHPGLHPFLVGASVVGVEAFFVLSGFLIGGILLRQFAPGRPASLPQARDFWVRRWFRTLPNYYLFVAVNAIVFWTGLTPYPMRPEYLLFLQNLWTFPPGPFGESWSLSVEEFFYLLLPLLILLACWLVRARQAALLAAAFALMAVPTVARLALAAAGTEPQPWNEGTRSVVLLRLDALGYGVLGAMAAAWRPALWNAHCGARAVVGVALAAVGVWLCVRLFFGLDAPLAYLLSLPLVSAGILLTLPWLEAIRPWGRTSRAAVTATSKYAYSLYLCHTPLAYLVLATMGAGPLQSLVWLGAAYAVAALVFHGFERPTTALRERFAKRA
jgi:peptidoglycan/LPS O-acetylase OafA/YrhL